MLRFPPRDNLTDSGALPGTNSVDGQPYSYCHSLKEEEKRASTSDRLNASNHLFSSVALFPARK